MKIGDLAKATGLSTSRIRFYEAQGVIAPATRAANGYRDYPDSMVDLLLFITQAQALGFSLAEIRAGGPRDGSLVPTCDAAKALLQRKLAEVDAHLAQVTALRAKLAGMLENLHPAQHPLAAE
jgi:DNA-binding transcriptional MerR regulator